MRASLLFLVAIGACHSSSASPSVSASASVPASASVASVSVSASASASVWASAAPALAAAPSPSAAALIAARPYRLDAPSSADGKALPLLVLFHGYGSSGAEFASMFHTRALADAKSIAIAIPDGTFDANHRRFWNATDACCNFGGMKIDDVGYLSAILDDVASKEPIDPKRVFLVGHSNGGFFAHRAACELSSRIAAIASIAGPTWKDASKCAPTEAVSVAQIQGDADTIIHIDGGHMKDDPSRPQYPSARETIADWASRDRCGPLSITDIAFDLDPILPGFETSVEASSSCPKSVALELWTVHGMGHSPHPSPAWAETIVSFFLAHPKP